MPSNKRRERYARQLPLPGWSEAAQKKLASSRALIVGAGGLGSPAAYYLAAAGVGNIIIVDFDKVELSNLNRQILHCACDMDRPKVESAKEKLEALNPDCNVVVHEKKLTTRNAKSLLKDADVILDCADGFENKYMLNDAAVALGKPLVFAGALAWSGQALFVKPGEGPCLRCVFPEPPKEGTYPTSKTIGILGAVAGAIGAVQAAEAIKYLTGIGECLIGRMLFYDALRMQWSQMKISRDKSCRVCGDKKRAKKIGSCSQYTEVD